MLVHQGRKRQGPSCWPQRNPAATRAVPDSRPLASAARPPPTPDSTLLPPPPALGRQVPAAEERLLPAGSAALLKPCRAEAPRIEPAALNQGANRIEISAVGVAGPPAATNVSLPPNYWQFLPPLTQAARRLNVRLKHAWYASLTCDPWVLQRFVWGHA